MLHKKQNKKTTGISASSNPRQDVPHAIPGVATDSWGLGAIFTKLFFFFVHAHA